MSALTAAWDITQKEGWDAQYEITVYQLGWRVGGKGASGRNMDPDLHYRNEEHGPHVWFGFYDNAFATMRTVLPEYVKAAPDSPFRELFPPAGKETDPSAAFLPIDDCTVMDPLGKSFDRWTLDLPVFPGDPGQEPPTPWQAALNILKWLAGRALKLESHPLKKSGSFFDAIGHLSQKLPAVFDRLRDFAGTSILEAAHAAASLFHPDPAAHSAEHTQLLDGMLTHFRETVLAPLSESVDTLEMEIRHALILCDIGVAVLKGMIADNVFLEGYDHLNHQDYSRWLERHGCRSSWSAPVQAVYGAAFAFKDGSTAQPNPTDEDRPAASSLAAGSALHASLRMYFAHHGAYLYKMHGSMGDTVAAPLYLALRARGVNFEFFHRIEQLQPSPDFSRIDSISLNVQAHTVGGVPYEPILQVPYADGSAKLPSWPNCPFYEKLVEGPQLQAGHFNLESDFNDWTGTPKVLERGIDFDLIVLGISIEALKPICAPLRQEPSGRWNAMLNALFGIETQCAQLWISRTTEELGWAMQDEDDQTAVAGVSVQPLDTWSDMSQTLPSEPWPASANVRSVQYLCGPLNDTTDPRTPPCDLWARKREHVQMRLDQFLDQYATTLWPKAALPSNPIAFDRSLLVSEYSRPNINLSDRYVISAAKTWRFRMEPWNSGFSNLFLAGDWTRNGIDAGCVESAVTAGRLAARALLLEDYPLLGESKEVRRDYDAWLASHKPPS